MDVFEAIKTRRSIRSFDPAKEVTDEQIEKLLEAARWAPSAGNLQDWFFVVVRQKEVREKLAHAARQQFVAGAPIVIVICSDLARISHYGKRGRELYTIQDTSLAAQNIWLEATEMGLGVCWVGAFDEEEVKQILGLENHLRPVALFPLGYPDEEPHLTSRRETKEISKVVKNRSDMLK